MKMKYFLLNNGDIPASYVIVYQRVGSFYSCTRIAFFFFVWTLPSAFKDLPRGGSESNIIYVIFFGCFDASSRPS